MKLGFLGGDAFDGELGLYLREPDLGSVGQKGGSLIATEAVRATGVGCGGVAIIRR